MTPTNTDQKVSPKFYKNWDNINWNNYPTNIPTAKKKETNEFSIVTNNSFLEETKKFKKIV